MWTHYGHKGMLEFPPSFCNGLGIIYIASFRGRTFDLTTRNMGSKFRYVLGKVLGTQDCPTLRLVSHHCVLYLNLIKNNFQYLYSKLTHTHTSMHLIYNHGIIIPNNRSYQPIKQKRAKPKYIYKL